MPVRTPRRRARRTSISTEGTDDDGQKRKANPASLDITQTPGRRHKGAPPALKEWLDMTIKKGLSGLATEFGTFRSYVPPSVSADAFSSHPEKNRYKDVLCIDNSRVKLVKPQDDYIHASYVDGSLTQRQFICCQGPLESTSGDFWRMVWQEQVPVIVMLCSVYENGKPKCAQYWPSRPNETLKFDSIEIKNLGGQPEKLGSKGACTITHLQLSQLEDGARRSVQHWQWSEWPDRGVPTNVRPMLHLRQRINKLGHPVVIHCSAGIGRTGSVAVLDICLGLVDKEQPCDVASIVRRVRDQRMHSVQNELQYILIHRALIDYIVGKWHMPPTLELDKFSQDYTTFVERRPAPSPSPAPSPA